MIGGVEAFASALLARPFSEEPEQSVDAVMASWQRQNGASAEVRDLVRARAIAALPDMRERCLAALFSEIPCDDGLGGLGLLVRDEP